MGHGHVIPFLGAGVGRIGRPVPDVWEPKEQFTPTADELAKSLAEAFEYPSEEDEPNRDLSRVAQFAEFRDGQVGVADELTIIFSHRFPPTAVHECLSQETRLALERGGKLPFPVLMTTNYDDSLERAFEAAEVDHDVLIYQDRRLRPGLWLHHRKRVSTELDPEAGDPLAPTERPVILKLHGGIDRTDPHGGSFIVSDSDYAGYVEGVLGTLPASVGRELVRASLLFLGYGLNDWNLRVFLLSVWRRQQAAQKTKSWAIEQTPHNFDLLFWRQFDVDLVRADLEDWVDMMQQTRP